MSLINKKNLLLSTLLLLVAFFIFPVPLPVWAAEDYQLGFTKQIGGTDIDNANSIAIDTAGNIYVAGNFSGMTDFDPSSGTYTMTSSGGRDVFVGKFSSTGALVWVKQMGGAAGDDIDYGLDVDASGNVYTTGNFVGTVDFNPGAGTYNLTAVAGNDAFVSKLDANGNFVWAGSMGGAGSNDIGRGIAVDSSGNVYIGGYFNTTTTADFDPGAGTYNLTSAGAGDIFLAKLDINGALVWAVRMGSTGVDTGQTLAMVNDDYVYISGYFNGTADFNPGAGTNNLVSDGGNDVFVSKFDKDGNFVWAVRMGGVGTDGGNYQGLAVDTAGNAYATSYFNGTANFGATELTSAGGNDSFVSKIDTDGNFVWAKGLGGTGSDIGVQCGVDGDGNVYALGVFSGTVDFNPSAGIYNLISAGSIDTYIIKLDANGSFLWAKGLGGTGTDHGKSITVDTNHNVYSSGSFSGTADFDPGAGTSNLVSSGDIDIFISQLVPVDNIPAAFVFTDQTNAVLDSALESNMITVSGINTTVAISISSCTGAACAYSVNGGAYTSSAGTVVNGDTVKVRQTSSASLNTTTTLTLSIGGITDTFSVQTYPDTTAPTITLTGSSSIILTQGETYTDAGATATDNIDGNLTSSITVNNPVNTNIIGTYTITYNVSDTASNAATQVIRTVKVVSGPSLPTSFTQTPEQILNTGQGTGSSGTLAVNGNTPFTTANRKVSLTFNNLDNPLITRLAISSDSDFTDDPLVGYVPFYEYDLCGTAVNCPDGKYTLYARYYTVYGQHSQTIPLTITLGQGTIAPVSSQAPLVTSSTASISRPSSFKPISINSPVFTTSLKKGMQSEIVRTLQTLLATDKKIYPEGLITGYFGALTEKAIQRFQLKYNIVSSASDLGFGLFGPKTKSMMKTVFGK